MNHETTTISARVPAALAAALKAEAAAAGMKLNRYLIAKLERKEEVFAKVNKAPSDEPNEVRVDTRLVLPISPYPVAAIAIGSVFILELAAALLALWIYFSLMA